MFEVQQAIRPDSPLSEEAVVEVRIPVSGEGDLREGAEGVDMNVVSVCSSMFRSDMATQMTMTILRTRLIHTSQCTLNLEPHARICMCNKKNVRAVRCCLYTSRRVHGSFDALNAKLLSNM